MARPSPAGPSRWWPLLLVAGWLVQAGLRAWLSRAQTVPLATPDESAYLIAARVMSGGVTANFSYSTLYPAGYPLLITPVFWFTHNPVTVYHAVLLGINAPLSALVMPLGYAACRRLGLERPWAFGVAMAAALLPAALFYSQYAMTDAIFPVLVLGWLLAVHSWLTLSSPRRQYAAAVGAALLAGYAYAVHSRGAIMVAGFVLVGVFVFWRRLVPRASAVAAAVALCVPLGVARLLNGHLSSVMYPSGPRTLAGEALIRLRTVHGLVFVLEMAIGQLWRFVLDGWGVSGLGLAFAVFVVVRRGFRMDLRIMAALAAGVTLVTAITSPAALPPTQPQAWASGRYLDGLLVVFFLAGAVVLLRAAPRQVLICAACVVPPTLVAAVVVAVYAGSSVPTSGFGAAFVFAEPAVLTQNWTRASVLLATAVALALLACAVAVSVVSAVSAVPAVSAVSAVSRFCGRWRAGVLCVGLGVVSLVASVQMTSHISQADTPAQERNVTALLTGTGLKPGQHLAIGTGLSWETWMPQAFEVWWAPLVFFHPWSQGPPPGATVVEVAWPSGESLAATWSHAPASWRVVLTDRADGWVAWRHR
ncbi:MAG: hypothetical protein ACRDPD_00220 [Streptosporangiaceae bacterium]